MPEARRPNRLLGEKSPYLLEHAYNPVGWYPWGPEALKKAKNDGKPILLSIGYSTCHWCHQLMKESFEDEATASIINKNFIPIKVDREERPELDSYYMSALQAMTGQGGWPLNVFLTPDLKPFYGGTYFPPESRYGMPAFKQVLEFVSNLWRDKRDEVTRNAEDVAKAIVEGQRRDGSAELSAKLLEDGYSALASSFDEEHGGFGRAPKFPLPLSIAFLLRYHSATGNELALRAVTKTLDEISSGGVRDHLAGGFHRYSTDRNWLVPHFEKMLYDNALLARVYIEAYQATGRRDYAEVARSTLEWLSAEMRGEEGAFYSAQDADTEAGEGAYYTWTPDEVGRVIGEKGSEAFGYIYGVTKNGNFEGGRTILHVTGGLQEAATKFGVASEELAMDLQKWRSKLLAERRTRPRPATDTKVLTSWNGLAISAFSLASRVLHDDSYLDAATRAARFVLTTNVREGRLLRRYAGGEAALDGTLEDYAFFGQGLLDLFEASGEPGLLAEAIRLTQVMLDQFQDGKGGGLVMSAEAPAKMVEGYDGPTPSGNSVAANNLLRVSEFTGEAKWREAAVGIIRHFSGDLEDQPSGHTNLLSALEMVVNGTKEVVVTAPTREKAGPMLDVLASMFLPDAVLVVATQEHYEELSKLTPLLEGREPGKGAVAYVCENFTCKLPARTASELRSQLSAPKVSAFNAREGAG